jgi:hypothetical protein
MVIPYSFWLALDHVSEVENEANDAGLRSCFTAAQKRYFKIFQISCPPFGFFFDQSLLKDFGTATSAEKRAQGDNHED